MIGFFLWLWWWLSSWWWCISGWWWYCLWWLGGVITGVGFQRSYADLTPWIGRPWGGRGGGVIQTPGRPLLRVGLVRSFPRLIATMIFDRRSSRGPWISVRYKRKVSKPRNSWPWIWYRGVQSSSPSSLSPKSTSNCCSNPPQSS